MLNYETTPPFLVHLPTHLALTLRPPPCCCFPAHHPPSTPLSLPPPSTLHSPHPSVIHAPPPSTSPLPSLPLIPLCIPRAQWRRLSKRSFASQECLVASITTWQPSSLSKLLKKMRPSCQTLPARSAPDSRVSDHEECYLHQKKSVI